MDKTNLLVEQTGEGCQLKRIHLRDGLKLKGGYFYKADLRGVKIENRDLSHAVFDNADMRGAILLNNDLDMTSFCGTDLRGSRFGGRKTYFHMTRFEKSDLRNVNWKNIIVDNAILNECTCDETTKIGIDNVFLKHARNKEAQECMSDELQLKNSFSK